MRDRFLGACGALACVMLAATGQAKELSPAIAKMYADLSVAPPTPTRMMVCYGFGCRMRTFLDFTAADRARLTQILAAGRASAEAERKAVANAVIWFDRHMGPIIGTNKRVANADFRYFDAPHNYDCQDTTRNTTSLLLILQDWKLLRYHTVGDPHYRGNLLIVQFSHNTAVLVDRKTGREWAVDMWTRGYGEPPDVKPVEEWVKER